jgi:hypothetical protein
MRRTTNDHAIADLKGGNCRSNFLNPADALRGLKCGRGAQIGTSPLGMCRSVPQIVVSTIFT